eukprot:CAMPEP_0197028052 /NCGR_PEP_ID=MMETSP1384-20130603/7848_1 /TAXON_ID=29189 /ORGANISM="Ammonia sp." /LENGTH=1209 /DNA_ID=CAMNT_0042456995 /DNA_START=176 /DNA_END=3805 /DNA_ORIENTATION=+
MNNRHSQPQINDAKQFLERVKQRFKSDKGVYDQFVDIMKNFKNDHINTGNTIDEVRELFSKHPDLFEGFRHFLPAAGLATREEMSNYYQSMNGENTTNGGASSDNHAMNGAVTANGHNDSSNATDQGTQPPDFNMAVTFICKIKQRFGATRKIYQDFLNILQHFQSAAQANDTSVVKDVKNRIRALFRDHPDLLDQFDYFLPPLTAHFSRGAVSAASNTQAADTNGSRKRNRQGDDLENQPDPKRRRRGGEKDKRGSTSVPGNASMSDSVKQERSSRSKRKHRNKERHHHHHRDSSKRRGEKLRDKKDGARGDEAMSDEDERVVFSDSDEELEEKHGDRLSHHSQSNLHANSNNASNAHNGAELATSSAMHDSHSNHNQHSHSDEHQGLRIFSKLRKDIPDHLYRHILTLTQLYPMGLTEFSVVGKLICDALREHGHTDLMKEFQKELQSSKQSWFFRSRGQNYYEYLTNNSLLKSCKSIQSSYRQLPQDVVQPRCSGRHVDAATVLNDYFVSKPRGGEGGGNNENAPGGRLKSTYNEALQKSEDDLFELDMMIQTNDAARKRLEQLYKTVMQPKNIKFIQSTGSTLMEIPPVEQRAISRLYSEHGHKVLNLLKKMPETTIPVVLKRLREKSQEWEALKNEMKPVWKVMAKKNYFKAHDFRFTIFKSNDLKRISFKNLCKQIEERHVIKQRRNQLMHSNHNMHPPRQTAAADEDDEDEDVDVDMSTNTNTNTNTNTVDNNTTTMDDDDEEDKEVKQEKEKDEEEEDEDDDVRMSAERDEDMVLPQLEFDKVHHSANRSIANDKVDLTETDIASQQQLYYNGFNGSNGVIGGVGLVGTSNHDHIIQQMGAGLHVELGEYMKMPKESKINNHDYRFVVYDKKILGDCVELIYQKANKEEVGKSKEQKRLFAEIMESLFGEFFNLDIKTSSARFLDNNVESDIDDEDTSPSPHNISNIIQKVDVENEENLNQIDVCKLDETQMNHVLNTYYYDNSNENDKEDAAVPPTVLYGNRHIYALFRYLHILYARMNYAFSLCYDKHPLYRWAVNAQQTKEEQLKKYQEFQSHLSKWLNEQIDDELFEDECRKIMGLKSYQLFTLNKVITQSYRMVCEIDCDPQIHPYYRLFLHFAAKRANKSLSKEQRKQNYLRHYIAASTINNTEDDELYQVSFHDHKILAISIFEPHQEKHLENSNNDSAQSTNHNDSADNTTSQ